DRLAQRRRERLGLALGVCVALQLRAGVGAVLDAVEPRGEQGRVAEIGVHVGAGYPALDAPRGPVADDPEAAGAVVAAPRDRGGRPALRGVALVRVDRGSDEQGQLPDVVAHAAEIVAER